MKKNIEAALIDFINALADFLDWLRTKVDILEEEQREKRKNRETVLEPKMVLIKAIKSYLDLNQDKEISTILLSTERVLWAFNNEPLPDSLYGIPIEWVGATNCDFALEVVSEDNVEILVPTGSLAVPLRKPLVSPSIGRR